MAKVYKVYGTGATAVWTLEQDGQPKLVALIAANKYIGNAINQSAQDLLLTKTSPSGGWRYASSSEDHYNFGKVTKLDFEQERFVTTKAPELIIQGKQITAPKIVITESGGGGGGGNTNPTDTTTDSTTDSGSKFNMKKILPIAGAVLVFGIALFWDKLTGKKRGKK